MERELLLLGILRQQEMHGYQIAEFIDHNLGICTDLKKPTAYFLLEKMHSAGWIEYSHSQEGKRPPRRVYHITPAGEQAFQQLLRENLASHTPLYFVDDVGLAFLDTLPAAPEAAALLRQRLTALHLRLQMLQAAPQHPGRAQWMVEHQTNHLQAEIHWTQEIITRLETSAAEPASPSTPT